MDTNIFFVGKVQIELPAIDSTNTYALQLLKKQPLPADGTLIWAHQQYGGRGQRNNVWYAQPFQNITASVILYPKKLPIHQQFYISKSVAVACCLFLNAELKKYKVFKTVKIKWPNDLVCDGKKIGGILIENTVMGSRLEAVVVGVGINVNQKKFVPEIENLVTSLGLLTLQFNFEIPILLQKLCSYVEVQYLRLLNDKLAEIDSLYFQNLYLFNEVARFEITATQTFFMGKITEVQPLGKVGIEAVDNCFEGVQYFDFKEIRLVFNFI